MKNKKLKSVIKIFLCLVISTGMWIGVKYNKYAREQSIQKQYKQTILEQKEKENPPNKPSKYTKPIKRKQKKPLIQADTIVIFSDTLGETN